jgi:hypothetical protein
MTTRGGSRGAWALGLLLAIALGGGARAATLTVHVEDGQTGLPLAGAFVMVGLYEGHPFPGNVRWTDGSGAAVFDDPGLVGWQTVTAGADGLGFTTLYAGALEELTLPLFPALLDTLMGGTREEVQGTVSNIALSQNDGNLDVALVMPAANASDFLFQDMLPLWTTPDAVDFPVIGEVLLPGNTYLPDQIELLFFHFAKSPWHMGVPGGRRVTFFSASARIAIADLIGGSVMQNMEVREIGVERDVPVAGPTQLVIDSDLDLARTLDARFFGVPPGDSLVVVSGATFVSQGEELALGYDTRGGLVDQGTQFLLSSRAPAGDIADATNIAVGAHADTSRAARYSAGIVDRSGFVPPYTVVFASWLRLPVLAQDGHYFAWEDPTEPGVSPTPTWTRSNLGLRAIDPADTTVAISVHWRVYAPAGARHFVLPLLPESAPGPAGGLPDPDQTADEDQLYWNFVAANPAGEGGQVIADFIHEATHWTQRWIPVVWDRTGLPEEIASGADRLRAAPNPAAGEVRLTWSVPRAGAARIEVRSIEGRLVRDFPAPPRGELLWDGRDARGRRVPAGVYWATLTVPGAPRPAQRIIRLSAAP